jgi:hypothetical protein
MDNKKDIEAEKIGGKHQPKVGGDETYVSSTNHSAQWTPHGLETSPIKSDSIKVSTNHSRNKGVVTFSLMTDVPKTKQDPSYPKDHFFNTTRYSLGHGVVYKDGSVDLTPFPAWTHDTRGHVDERAIKFMLRDHLDSKVKNPKTGEVITVGEYHGLKSSLKEDLRRWFKEKWTAQDGSECGDYKGRGRVKCRPSRRVSEKSPQTWSEMSPEEKKKAVRKKQEAHRKGKQFSSHKTGKTWDGPKNKYKPGKKKMNESFLLEDDVIMSGENPTEYRRRLLARIQSGDISRMDNHDRVHGALAYIDSIRDSYEGTNRNINLVVAGLGNKTGKIGFKVHGIGGSGKHLITTPLAMGSSHKQQEETPIKNIYGLQISSYPNLKSEHRETLRRLMDFRGLREMKEQIKQLFLERRQNKDCGCNQIQEEKEKKPYKGFKKGKNHPEGGLSRAEAKRQGIHAGIETKDEAKRKGGFNKLSKKTQSRRKSFCARMCGMKRRRTSSKTARDPKSKINAALRVWGCRCGTNESYEPQTNVLLDEKFWKKAGLGLAAAGLIGAAAIGLKGNSNPTETSGNSTIKTQTTQYGDETTGGEKREISGDGWESTREASWSKTGPGVKSTTTSGKSSTNKGTYTPAKPRSGKGVPSGSGGGGIDESYEPQTNILLEKRGSCWEGYKQEGMKKKNGRMVPNCVPVNESILNEENKPTNSKLWSRAKALARKKFDVYPSAYANAWAAKWYKKHGGGWKKSKKNITESFIEKYLMREEVVNKENKGSMSKSEIKGRDRIAKSIPDGKYRSIKGDSPKETKYRVATWLKLKKRKRKQTKKTKED